jgi:hypothetical protein
MLLEVESVERSENVEVEIHNVWLHADLELLFKKLFCLAA